VSSPPPAAHSNVERHARDDSIPLQFMRWIKRGLDARRIEVNASGSLIHIVAEGMLLVSPRIFEACVRERAGEHGGEGAGPAQRTDAAKRLQREVLNAGWHLVDDRGRSVLAYQVARKGQVFSRIWGVVILNPERFVQPLPAVNPLLVRTGERSGAL